MSPEAVPNGTHPTEEQLEKFFRKSVLAKVACAILPPNTIIPPSHTPHPKLTISRLLESLDHQIPWQQKATLTRLLTREYDEQKMLEQLKSLGALGSNDPWEVLRDLIEWKESAQKNPIR